MSDRFIDTNILVYLASDDERKAGIAQGLLSDGGVISVQVLNELTNVARRKMKLSWQETNEFLYLIRSFTTVEPLTLQTHELGLELAARYSLSVYDAMIISSGLLAGCNTLLSEDMQNGLKVADKMTIQNPFM